MNSSVVIFCTKLVQTEDNTKKKRMYFHFVLLRCRRNLCKVKCKPKILQNKSPLFLILMSSRRPLWRLASSEDADSNAKSHFAGSCRMARMRVSEGTDTRFGRHEHAFRTIRAGGVGLEICRGGLQRRRDGQEICGGHQKFCGDGHNFRRGHQNNCGDGHGVHRVGW